MVLKDLLALDTAGGNPLEKLVNNFYLVDTAFHRQINFSPESPEYRISSKLDGTRELIEELEKLVDKDSDKKIGLANLDLTQANKIFETFDDEESIMLQVMLEGAWNQVQDDRRISEEFIQKFVTLEAAYNHSVLPLSPVSMETFSDQTSDEEQISSKRQKTEEDVKEFVALEKAYNKTFSASKDQDQKFADAYLKADINSTFDTSIIPQHVVDIKITSDDILKLKECIEKSDLTFIKEFAVKNNVAEEEAYSLLLTQTMAEHTLPNKAMKELFDLMEPDLTIFNAQINYSFISVLLTFGDRNDTLYLKEYVNRYKWEKVELDQRDQHAIHNTLLMSNAIEVTRTEYIEFVTDLLGNICSTESVEAALL